MEKIVKAAAEYIKSLKLDVMLGDLADRLDHGPARTIIFGEGGTGKSTLGKLIERTGTQTGLENYRMSHDIERVRAQGRLYFPVYVLPGQIEKKSATLNNIPFNTAQADRVLFIH